MAYLFAFIIQQLHCAFRPMVDFIFTCIGGISVITVLCQIFHFILLGYFDYIAAAYFIKVVVGVCLLIYLLTFATSKITSSVNVKKQPIILRYIYEALNLKQDDELTIEPEILMQYEAYNKRRIELDAIAFKTDPFNLLRDEYLLLFECVMTEIQKDPVLHRYSNVANTDTLWKIQILIVMSMANLDEACTLDSNEYARLSQYPVELIPFERFEKAYNYLMIYKGFGEEDDVAEIVTRLQKFDKQFSRYEWHDIFINLFSYIRDEWRSFEN